MISINNLDLTGIKKRTFISNDFTILGDLLDITDEKGKITLSNEIDKFKIISNLNILLTNKLNYHKITTTTLFLNKLKKINAIFELRVVGLSKLLKFFENKILENRELFFLNKISLIYKEEGKKNTKTNKILKINDNRKKVEEKSLKKMSIIYNDIVKNPITSNFQISDRIANKIAKINTFCNFLHSFYHKKNLSNENFVLSQLKKHLIFILGFCLIYFISIYFLVILFFSNLI